MKKIITKILKTFPSALLVLLATCYLLLLFPSPARAATIQKPPSNLGLSAYWSFNEGAGNITHDFSGNSNTGTLLGTTLPTWISGKRAGALSFDGSSGYITGSGTNLTNLGAGANVTISAWVKPLSVSGTQTIFNKGASGVCFNYGLVLVGGNLRARNSNSDYSVSSTNLSANIWQHITIVFSGSTVTGYVNASSTGSSAQGTSNCADTNWSIGRRAYNSSLEYFGGGIDDLRIYNRALSAADIQTLYNAGAVKRIVPNKLGLVGYWSMDEGGGSIAHDFSGNQNGGTLLGTSLPTWGSGKRNTALNFTFAGSSYLNIPNSSSLNFGSGDLTVSGWIKPSFLNDAGGVVYKGATTFNTNGSGWEVRERSSGTKRIEFCLNAGSGTCNRISNTNLGSLIPNTWYFFAYTYVRSTGNVQAYLNNAPPISGTNTTSTYTDSYPLQIGTAENGSIDGAIDDIKVYNRALSAAEVTGLYQSGEVKINAPQNTKLTTGLVGYWTFNGPDMTTSTSTDVSGNGNNGLLTGTSKPKVSIGKIGQGLNFDGNGYIDVGNKSSLNVTDLSISTWVKPQNGAVGILGKWGTSPYYYIIMSANDICIRLSNATFNTYCTGSSVVPYNQWSHIAMTVNSSTFRLNIYVNNTLYGPYVLDPGQIGPYTNSNSFNIGNIGNALGGYNFKGIMDEVRIYNRVLSPAEVKQLYLMGK